MHAWDELHQTIEGIRPLRKDFFQPRIVNDDTAHFRGFAADTLAAMDVIGLFILIMFDAGDFAAMEGELRCFWHMYTNLQILRRGRFADLARLKWEIAQHHLMFFMVYPKCMKPKLHYLFHVPACWEFWESLISCYGAEAGHRDVCKIFRFNLRKPSTAAIYHAVYHLFEAAGKCNTYEPVFLIEPVSPCDREYLDCGVRFTVTHTHFETNASGNWDH